MRQFVSRWFFCCCLLLVPTGCLRPPAPLDHGAYIWQRSWRPALLAAMRDTADLVQHWRVLAAETDAGDTLVPMAVNWQALRESGRPVVMVVRIEGQLPALDEAALLTGISALRRQWATAGVAPAGLEIDHDCATARLGAYARFLAQIRQSLDNTMPLSLTVLPAWLDAADLTAVLAETDEAVLQVHAVNKPGEGLFDAAQAYSWITRFAARSDRPFRVALPTYGTRVAFDVHGTPVAVESESPQPWSTPDTRELTVAPTAVAGLLERLRVHPPRGLRGTVWFRLPTSEDRRAWSLATWRAVIEGRPLETRLTARLQEATSPGLFDLVLENNGALDAPWPAVEVASGCAAADAVGGYALRPVASGYMFHPPPAGLLPSQGQVVIGWLRCSTIKVPLHVVP